LSYVDDLAAAIRHSIAPELLPDGDISSLFRMYAVLAMAKGEGVMLEDVHDAWAAWMSAEDPEHRSLKPLRELPPDVQCADQPYLDAIRAVARDRNIAQRGTVPGLDEPAA
jgi:hypothetical protein